MMAEVYEGLTPLSLATAALNMSWGERAEVLPADVGGMQAGCPKALVPEV